MFVLDGDLYIKVLKKVFFAVFKHPPDMVRRPATGLTTGLVEPNGVLVNHSVFLHEKNFGKHYEKIDYSIY